MPAAVEGYTRKVVYNMYSERIEHFEYSFGPKELKDLRTLTRKHTDYTLLWRNVLVLHVFLLMCAPVHGFHV